MNETLAEYLYRKFNDKRLTVVTNRNTKDLKAKLYIKKCKGEKVYRFKNGDSFKYSLDEYRNWEFCFRKK